MNPLTRSTLYSKLLVVWLAAFTFEVVQIAHWASVLHNGRERLDEAGQQLRQENRDLNLAISDIKSNGKEMEFLQSLVNVLPQEKGFMRTQKAIAWEVEGLREKVGQRLHGELHILVDTRANKLYLKKGLKLLWEADCSVGKGGLLWDHKTGRRWTFVTPHGQFEVLSKIEKPFWLKPDWAFVESKEPIPPPDDPKRKVEGELGAYVLNLGDGYLIHGTKTEAMLGRSVSHGCVRLGADNLKKLFESVPVGTRVFIY